MNKDQILEKITNETSPDGIYTGALNTDKLSSYLATLEERLEKIECSAVLKTIINNIHIQRKHEATPTEVKEDIGYLVAAGGKIVEPWEKELEDNCIQWFNCPRTADAVKYMKSFIKNLIEKRK